MTSVAHQPEDFASGLVTVVNTTAAQPSTPAHVGIVHFRRCRRGVLLVVETLDSRSRWGKLRVARNRRGMRGLL